MEQGKDIRGPSFTECCTQEPKKFLIHFKESEGTCLSVCKKVGNGTRGRHIFVSNVFFASVCSFLLTYCSRLGAIKAFQKPFEASLKVVNRDTGAQ